jgi:hypothetical protein
MTGKQSTLAIGGLILGASLVARQMRSRRALELAGRVVLITGGSRGLGLLMAREVGRLGAQVVIAARDEAELLRAQRDLLAHEIHASILIADVATEAQAQRMVSQVIDRHGRLDALINNAGVIMVGPVDHMTVSDFEEAMATHFWGPLHTMLAAIPHMRDAGGGRIVNISSIGGKIGVPHLADWRVDGAESRARPVRHSGDDGVPGADANRLAVQRLVQGPPPRGVRVVRHRRLTAAAVDRRAAGGGADHRRHAPWRRRVDRFVAGTIGRRGRSAGPQHTRQSHDAGQSRASRTHWHPRQRESQRLAQRFAVGPVRTYAPDRTLGRRE